MLWNVYIDNEYVDDVADRILLEDPDVLVLLEVGDFGWAKLKRVRERMPYVMTALRNDSFGMAILSRKPLREGSVLQFSKTSIPSLISVFDHDGEPVTLIATHPLPPSSDWPIKDRDLVLGSAARLASAVDGDVLLVGDFNLTPWTPRFRRLLHDSGLQDTRKGFGTQPTWPSGLPWLWLPLDHILVPQSWNTLERYTGPFTGSDHRPVLAVLQRG